MRILTTHILKQYFERTIYISTAIIYVCYHNDLQSVTPSAGILVTEAQVSHLHRGILKKLEVKNHESVRLGPGFGEGHHSRVLLNEAIATKKMQLYGTNAKQRLEAGDRRTETKRSLQIEAPNSISFKHLCVYNASRALRHGHSFHNVNCYDHTES